MFYFKHKESVPFHIKKTWNRYLRKEHSCKELDQTRIYVFRNSKKSKFWEYSMVSIYFHHIHHFLFQHVSFLFLSHLVEHEPLRSRFSAICQPQEEFCIILCLLSWFSSCKSSSQRYLANSPSLDCIFRFTSEGNNPIRHPLVYNHDHNRYHLLYIKLVEKF